MIKPEIDLELSINALRVQGLSIDEFNLNELNIYPNPVVTLLFLPTISEYMIYNQNGILVLSGMSNKINVQNLHNGLYFIKYNNKIAKFIKK